MHVAQGCRKAAYDEVRDRPVQVFISHGFGAWRVTVVDLPGGSRKPDLYRIVQRRRAPFFNDIERLSVENSDFVERMDLVVRCQHCPVGDEAYPFDLSGSAAEIRFCLGDDDVGVEPLRGSSHRPQDAGRPPAFAFPKLLKQRPAKSRSRNVEAT